MGWFTHVPVARAGAVYLPVKPRFPGLVFQDAMGQRASADITKTNHQDLHAAKIEREGEWSIVIGRQ
jgi:hypothetical protein